jgi:hypothetical protein
LELAGLPDALAAFADQDGVGFRHDRQSARKKRW